MRNETMDTTISTGIRHEYELVSELTWWVVSQQKSLELHLLAKPRAPSGLLYAGTAGAQDIQTEEVSFPLCCVFPSDFLADLEKKWAVIFRGDFVVCRGFSSFPGKDTEQGLIPTPETCLVKACLCWSALRVVRVSASRRK